jgi:hypothetical protein
LRVQRGRPRGGLFLFVCNETVPKGAGSVCSKKTFMNRRLWNLAG